MIKKYIKSQTGAALILVLFVVLFLSITGALLLNATTYSQKSIINNTVEEKEFYLAEGALDLALDKIKKTNNAYNYLNANAGNLLLREEIPSESGNFVTVNINPTLTPKPDGSQKVKIEATNESASNLTRTLELITFPSSKIVEEVIILENDIEDTNFDLNEIQGRYVDNLEGVYGQIKSRLLSQPNKISLNQNEIINNTIDSPNNIVIIDKLTYGGGFTLTIEENTIVLVTGDFTINGGGSGKGLTINKGAVLVAESILKNGNPGNITLNGGLISKDLSQNGNSWNIKIGDDAGLPVKLLDIIDDIHNKIPASFLIDDYFTERN